MSQATELASRTQGAQEGGRHPGHTRVSSGSRIGSLSPGFAMPGWGGGQKARWSQGTHQRTQAAAPLDPRLGSWMDVLRWVSMRAKRSPAPCWDCLVTWIL